ncbi:MAG: IS66 family insertion sequence element accessory protein TnpB [Lewinellaceae bacterium]|nr:IS66 family insertion sequence element accessory protein TnpB [Lewinellaceae bacterium]
MIKILVWDRSGFVVWSKRLERGTFELPRNTRLGFSAAALGGVGDDPGRVSLSSVQRRKRYSREKAAA